jgi:hypothetical protein
MEDMTNRALAPEEIFGAFARELAHRLYDAPSWDARFAWLDQALSRQMHDPRDVPAGVRCASRHNTRGTAARPASRWRRLRQLVQG